MDKPKVYVSMRPGSVQGEPEVIFSAVFSSFAAKQLGLDIVAEAARLFAEEFKTNPELSAMIDREKLSNEITAVIGRAFVERLLGPPAGS